MTRQFSAEGTSVPVTIVEVGPCVVTQVRSPETDGYDAVQIGWGDMKARNSTIPMIGHDAKAGAEPRRLHREFKPGEGESFELGQEIGVDVFEGVKFEPTTLLDLSSPEAVAWGKQKYRAGLDLDAIRNQLEEPVHPTTVGGRPAARFAYRYLMGEGSNLTVHAEGCLVYGTYAHFTIGMAGPTEGPDRADTEFARAWTSVRIA